mgnify:CR=1 FL=1
MKARIEIQEKAGIALTKQKSIDTANFPFTLNTNIGCLTQCNYCYLQQFPFNLHTKFGEEVKIKAWLPERLEIELEKYKDIPQHLKRVQINSATEGYLPQAIKYTQEHLGRDLMAEILLVFKNQWSKGNCWMVHLVTKSHLIVNHLDIISDMKNQIQVELTITSLDEQISRNLEGFASSVSKRIDVIEKFAVNDVFVRAMCMPFIGNRTEAELVQKTLLDHGAKAFKHKSMNYWDEASLLEGKKVPANGKRDIIFEDLLIKSGEPCLDDSGNSDLITVLMPDKRWKKFTDQLVSPVNWGYNELNDIDWKYIR